MISLFSLFWKLTTFRAGPADVPGASSLVPLMVVVFLLVNVGVRIWLSLYAPWEALISSGLILLSWSVIVYALLAFKSVQTRFVQTFVALLGVDTVITLLNLFPGALNFFSPPASPLSNVLQVAVMVLFIWDMLAKGAIYRAALNVGPMQGNLLAMCFSLGFTYLDIMLFSPVTPH